VHIYSQKVIEHFQHPRNAGVIAILSIRSETGDRPIVAEGAVVEREQKIPASIIVGDNPAKKIRDTSEKEKEFRDHTRRLYRDLARKYCEIGMERIDAP